MTLTTFVQLFLVLALTIIGRHLRENAFRDLPAEHKVLVADKMANYTSVELVPFLGLTLALLALALFASEWLKRGTVVFVALVVVLVAVFHIRTRHRFRALGVPAAFFVRYETSRIVSYCALAALLSSLVWTVMRL
jgi:hypothetical protein